MTIDTTPPPAPVITASPTNPHQWLRQITSDNVSTLKRTAEPNRTVTISEDTLGVLRTASADGRARRA